MKVLLLLSGSLLCSGISFAQEFKESPVQIIQNSPHYQKEDLLQNGINPSKIAGAISAEDLEKLMEFDFSPYRNYASVQQVLLDNGQTIELFSVETMQAQGKVFPPEYIISKREVDLSTVNHNLVPKIQLGFGKTKAVELH